LNNDCGKGRILGKVFSPSCSAGDFALTGPSQLLFHFLDTHEFPLLSLSLIKGLIRHKCK
jgi:hypothetical protein